MGPEGKHGGDPRGQNLSESGSLLRVSWDAGCAMPNPQVPGDNGAEILESEFLGGWIFFLDFQGFAQTWQPE